MTPAPAPIPGSAAGRIGQRSRWPHDTRRARRVLVIVVITLTGAVTAVAPASADTELITNPGFEALDPGGFPTCWEQAGYGDGNDSFTVDPQAHSGADAMRVTVSGLTTGDRKAMMQENSTCAPPVVPGHQYDLSLWYTTSTPDTVITMFRHDPTQGWQYWTDLSTLPVTSAYTQASVLTPAVPPGTDRITWGVTIYGDGTLLTDDYSMVDATQTAGPPDCTAGAACTQGAWTVLPDLAPVRSIHAILLNNGKVLLMAGSGNDPMAFAAGTFTSAVYDPVAGTFTQVPTPADMFCSGHIQLPDGRVLVLGGNAAYPDSTHGYEGLATSFIFDPATDTYTRINDLTGGHWYPSATELGNGDVLSLGGLAADSSGSVATEYFSLAGNRWLSAGEIAQTWSFWGLYPSMILLRDGRLFYTGSHVFGNGLPGAGASIYDYAAATVTDVPGLRDKDERDQSASVLLPPAQDQKVITMGGGNITTNVDANRDTDLIDLTQADPTYTPGPMLPTGTMSDGSTESPTQGKMYVSAVILPDATVFETGGGLHNRADPVHEASVYDPRTNSFTAGMATDPVDRTYHSEALLLPDGRVLAAGNNPGDGSFDMHISLYSPTYLFNGPRPQITQVANPNWTYGDTQQITVDSAVTAAALIRPAAVTHSSDPNQRYVALPMTPAGGTIGLAVPTNPNLAPPGWYMLFVTTASGIPSVATWVHLG